MRHVLLQAQHRLRGRQRGRVEAGGDGGGGGGRDGEGRAGGEAPQSHPVLQGRGAHHAAPHHHYTGHRGALRHSPDQSEDGGGRGEGEVGGGGDDGSEGGCGGGGEEGGRRAPGWVFQCGRGEEVWGATRALTISRVVHTIFSTELRYRSHRTCVCCLMEYICGWERSWSTSDTWTSCLSSMTTA